MTRSTRLRALLAAAFPLAAVAAFALPSAAQAAVIGFNPNDGNLAIVDVGSENNDLLLRVLGNEILITDSVPFGPLAPGSPCQIVNQRQAFCPASVAQVTVSTGFGNDRVEYRLPHQGHVQLGAGNDSLIAGRRQALGRAIQPVRYVPDRFVNGPNDGFDTINYAGADRGVSLTPEDKLANDGRPGIDRENVDPGFDVIFGSQFDDSPLFGTDASEYFYGLGGNDFIAGGHGDDFFLSYTTQDGADDYHGGPGYDTIDYFGRTGPLRVSLDNVANDGEAGERDNVRSNVENIYGGNGDDIFESFGAFSRLDGRGGNDRLFGGAGPDTLIGGPGRDLLNAGSGNDVIDARDGGIDDIDCGPNTDTLTRDSSEGKVLGCEKVTVGKLRLTNRSGQLTAGKTARLQLSWRHPKAWKQLRTIELRLTRDGVPVGAVTIRTRDQRITADGAVDLVRKRSRISTEGKTVTARLAVRLGDAVAGATLKAEVEATDRRGRRQLERDAATIRVAR